MTYLTPKALLVQSNGFLACYSHRLVESLRLGSTRFCFELRVLHTAVSRKLVSFHLSDVFYYEVSARLVIDCGAG